MHTPIAHTPPMHTHHPCTHTTHAHTHPCTHTTHAHTPPMHTHHHAHTPPMHTHHPCTHTTHAHTPPMHTHHPCTHTTHAHTLLYCRVPAPSGYGPSNASEWFRGLWRTKGSDFESLVYMSGLVFQVPHSQSYLGTSSGNLEASSQSTLSIRNIWCCSNLQ